MTPQTLDGLAIERLIKDAQARLTLAGDLVEPRLSLLHLSEALTLIAKVERLLHPGDGTDQPDAVVLHNLAHRYRRKLLGTETTPEVIDHVLSSVAASQWDAIFVNTAIPAVWRILKGVRAEAESNRPWSIYWLMGRRALALLITTCLLYFLTRLILPFGAWVVYYNDVDLQRPAALRVEFTVDKAYAEERPASFTHRNRWSARWSGSVFAPENDTYEFYVQSDDGVRLWIDGQLIIDHWQDTKWQTSGQHGSIKLSAGKHRFRLEHYKRDGNGAVRVRWTGGGIPPNTVLGYPYLYKY